MKKLMRVKSIKMLAIVLVAHACAKADAQIQPGEELQEIMRIAEVYKRVPSLSFNTEVSLRVNPNSGSPIELMSINYQLSDGRYAATLDSMEFVQGYNYNVTVYHDMHIVMVSKPRSVMNSVVELPVLDSLFRANFMKGMTVTELTDSTRKLALSYLPDTANLYQIFYRSTTYLVDSIKYQQMGEIPEINDSMPVNQFITVKFKLYNANPISNSVFDESRFVYTDGVRFFLKPDYSTYELMVNDNFSIEGE